MQLGREPGVGLGVAGAGRRAGERVRPHDVAVDRDQQLGRGADEAVDREAVARTEAGPQPQQHGVDVDRLVRLDRDRRGRSRPCRSARRAPRRAPAGDGGQVVVDVDSGRSAYDAGGSGRRRSGRASSARRRRSG